MGGSFGNTFFWHADEPDGIFLAASELQGLSRIRPTQWKAPMAQKQKVRCEPLTVEASVGTLLLYSRLFSPRPPTRGCWLGTGNTFFWHADEPDGIFLAASELQGLFRIRPTQWKAPMAQKQKVRCEPLTVEASVGTLLLYSRLFSPRPPTRCCWLGTGNTFFWHADEPDGIFLAASELQGLFRIRPTQWKAPMAQKQKVRCEPLCIAGARLDGAYNLGVKGFKFTPTTTFSTCHLLHPQKQFQPPSRHSSGNTPDSPTCSQKVSVKLSVSN